jgi:hypothetical protein
MRQTELLVVLCVLRVKNNLPFVELFKEILSNTVNNTYLNNGEINDSFRTYHSLSYICHRLHVY